MTMDKKWKSNYRDWLICIAVFVLLYLCEVLIEWMSCSENNVSPRARNFMAFLAFRIGT